MNQFYATILRSLLGNDVIESTLQEVEKTYPVLFEQLAELSNGTNQEEMVDYSLHIVDAFLKLKQSEIYTNPIMFKVFKSFKAVADSYELKGQQHYNLSFDTALVVVILAIMCGLRDLKSITSYFIYANQYLQLVLPHMLHPGYRINEANFRAVMRLANYDVINDFFTNFFTRAKVATRLNPPAALHKIQPVMAGKSGFNLASEFRKLSHNDLAPYLSCLGLDHGLILGERPLLFMCADQLVINGYDYLLSLNHLSPEAMNTLNNRLSSTASRSKLMIDNIDGYFDVLDEISEDMKTIVCIKRLDPTTHQIENFYFLSTLPQTEESLYQIMKTVGEYEDALPKQTGSYLISISQDENEDLDDYLPLRQDYNRFAVDVLSYEREVTARLAGHVTVKPWDKILFRNGSNPICAVASLFYYYLSDVIDQKRMLMHQRRCMFDLLGANPSGAIPHSLLQMQ